MWMERTTGLNWTIHVNWALTNEFYDAKKSTSKIVVQKGRRANTDEGGGGLSQMLTIADGGGRGGPGIPDFGWRNMWTAPNWRSKGLQFQKKSFIYILKVKTESSNRVNVFCLNLCFCLTFFNIWRWVILSDLRNRFINIIVIVIKSNSFCNFQFVFDFSAFYNVLLFWQLCDRFDNMTADECEKFSMMRFCNFFSN